MASLRAMLFDAETPLREGGVSRAYGFYLTVAVVVTAVAIPALFLVLVRTLETVIGRVLFLFGPSPSAAPLMLKLFLVVMPGAAAVFLVRAWLTIGYVSYLLTDRRLITRYGLLARRVSQTDVTRIQDVHVQQSIMGRLLNYGLVVVETAGSQGALQLQYVASPDDWARDILQQARNSGSSPSSLLAPC